MYYVASPQMATNITKLYIIFIPDPGVKRAPDPGSGTLHLLIDFNFIFILFSLTMPLLLFSTFRRAFDGFRLKICTLFQVGSKLSTALPSGKLLM
jgi:hypothetical protein